jgi:hypothetical protein
LEIQSPLFFRKKYLDIFPVAHFRNKDGEDLREDLEVDVFVCWYSQYIVCAMEDLARRSKGCCSILKRAILKEVEGAM